MPMRIWSVWPRLFIRVEKEYIMTFQTSWSTEKSLLEFGHNSVRISILKANWTPINYTLFLSLKYKIWIPGMSKHDVDKSMNLSQFHVATLKCRGFPSITIAIQPSITSYGWTPTLKIYMVHGSSWKNQYNIHNFLHTQCAKIFESK
jgi:hypothetical protein